MAFFVVLNLLVFWLLGRAMQPLGGILAGLWEMEKGRFDVRLPDYDLPEFASISHTFNRMAQALEDSIAENGRLALIAQQSSDAIIIHDLEGRVSFWNPAAERMFGYSAAEIVGKSAMQIAPPERQSERASSWPGDNGCRAPGHFHGTEEGDDDEQLQNAWYHEGGHE